MKKLLLLGSLSTLEAKDVIDSLLQLYFTLSQHVFFPLLSSSDIGASLSCSGSSNSGHFPVLHKASCAVAGILDLLVDSGQTWSNVVFNAVLTATTDLPR